MGQDSRGRNGELLPGTLELMVLKVLRKDALHGYAIARAIRQRSRDVLQVEEGSLYPALHRMEKRGLLSSHWEKSEANRRAKFYRITDNGLAQLVEQQKRWKRISSAVNHVLGLKPA